MLSKDKCERTAMKEFLSWLIVIFTLPLPDSFGFDNLAVRKTAQQSSFYGNNSALGANLAVDDDLDQYFPNIACTNYERDVYWYVNLGSPRNIQRVTIYYRKDRDPSYNTGYRHDFSGFSLYISTSGFMTRGGFKCIVNSRLPPLLYTIQCARVGQYVTIYNHRDDGRSILQLGEVQVFGCINPNVYGTDCGYMCPRNCLNRWCNINDGNCFSCIEGYTGSLCNHKCLDGYYGANCLRTCSANCIDPTNCNHVNGTCAGGCKSGWNGELCNKTCGKGEYGPNCVEDCGHCESGLTCDRQNGHCDSCKHGFYPPLCKTKCNSGSYGLNCSNLCAWKCVNNETCNFDNGYCPTSYADGWRNPTCDIECIPGYYGQGCLLNCSNNCKNNEYCHHVTGTCNLGCNDGFYGPRCFDKCSQNCINDSTCNPDNGFCDSGCKSGFFGSDCTLTCSSHCEQKAFCMAAEACKEIEVSYVVPIAASVSGTVAVILVISVICIIIRRRKPDKKYSGANESQEQSSSINLQTGTSKYLGMREENEYVNPDALNIDSEDNPEDEEIDENVYFNLDDIKNYEDISIQNLQTEIQNKSIDENAAFTNEYESIPRGEEHHCTAGKMPENTKKNRYISTYPYDHSRIILKTADQKDSDYINANYIENLDGQRRYIAAQGPKRNTDVDFWKMVWQESVHKIVMVTNLKEGGKDKCVKYWPDPGRSVTKGEIEIWTENEKTYAFYIIRKLKILHRIRKEERVLYQFQYTQWKDHGAPDSLGLVIFHNHIMRTTVPQKNSLTLVHCSAGIGRTGTYIALDSLYQYGQNTRKINVPAYVKIMRKDRMSMIQTVDQYIVLYKALHEAFRSKDDVIPREKFHEHMESQNNPDKPAKFLNFQSGYNGLQSLKPHYSQNDFKGGNENSNANFTKTVLPVEDFRCKLPSISKGRGNYYNAVFIQSYTKQDGFICAQFPLVPYTEDFLRLVYDFESYIVVSVELLSEIESTRIWMPSKGSSLTVGDFAVHLNSTSDTSSSNSVKTTTLSLNKMGRDARVIQVLESNSWSTKNMQLSDLTSVLELVIQVQKAHSFKQDCVITVLSGDGASRSGVFCTIFNALQEVQIDNEVDIFTIARQMQIRRPEIFSTKDEYQFCFKAIDMYLTQHPADKDDIYVNSEDWYAEVL